MHNHLQFHFLARRLPSQLLKPVPRRQFSGSLCRYREFQEGDIVILREKKDSSHNGSLVKLKQFKSFHSHRGAIEHSDIIGKQPRQLVYSSKGTPYRIHEPTLAEYVRLTPRLVTPIYPKDTNLIVSLLDIHVDPSLTPVSSEPPLEILEAGTGHGALTLHLSRAIHAANPPLPQGPTYASSDAEPEDTVYLGESVSDLYDHNLQSWKTQRRAILHTLDISEKHSKHAEKIVEGFRNGMYAKNVEFHVGDVTEWVEAQQASRKSKEPFLSHVFLDLPNAERHLANVWPALHVNGILAVFNPSITQIAESVETIREQRLPLLLDQVVELGVWNVRQWDVRAVRPRASLKQEAARNASSQLVDSAPSDESSLDSIKGQERRDDELAAALEDTQAKWAMVCRPKAGESVDGGGFLALWRRMEPAVPGQSSENPEK